MNWTEFFSAFPTEISVAIIGACSIAVSALISTRVAKTTTKTEIDADRERREEAWRHEREEDYNAEFAEMVTAITLFIRNQTEKNYERALESVNIVRVKEHGASAETLDTLYHLISEEYNKELFLEEAQLMLDKAIKQSREHYGQKASGDHGKPLVK